MQDIFYSFGVDYILKDILKFIGNKNIEYHNKHKIQTYDSEM